MSHLLFESEACALTRGIVDMEICETDLQRLFTDHFCGCWGHDCDEDRKENKKAIINHARVLTSHRLQLLEGECRLWIITEADRSITTMLLPEEY